MEKLHQDHERVLATLPSFKHLPIYNLLCIDANIHYMLKQMHIWHNGTHTDDNSVIVTELCKFANQRDSELRRMAGAFPELERLRSYNKRNNRGHADSGDRQSGRPQPDMCIKSKICRNILCADSTNCSYFHGTFADHTIYLYRCGYKSTKAPDGHICGQNCPYYHDTIERTYWANKYSAIGLNGRAPLDLK